MAEAVRKATFESSPKSSIPFVSADVGHLVVVPAAQRAFMYDSIPYPFRQNSDYRWQTRHPIQPCFLVSEQCERPTWITNSHLLPL